VDKSFLDGGYVDVRLKPSRYSNLLINKCSRFLGLKAYWSAADVSSVLWPVPVFLVVQ